MTEGLFVSSVQKELAAERRAVRDFVRGDRLLSRYFDVFLFEDHPAKDRQAGEVYLNEVRGSRVYVGIFGNEYGWEDAEGKSPTEREFDLATETRKTRLIFVKGDDDAARHPKMLNLIRRAQEQLVRRRFGNAADLTRQLYASLILYLEDRRLLDRRPFAIAACDESSLDDISSDATRWFLDKAREERRYSVRSTASSAELLTHLGILVEEKPSNSGILLFGSNPQRFLPSAEVKCLHYHGPEIVRPIPSYQVFKGTLFEQVDQSTDFVMSKLARIVPSRDRSAEAFVEYEIPRPAITEIVVNAVAHRDYVSRSSVQVYVFSDRVEVWNPGELPPGLTPAQLREPHSSVPFNPFICEALYLAHYIEKAGTGTLDVIAQCRAAQLPEPRFEQRGADFVVTLWRQWLTDAEMDRLGLTQRQREAVALVKQHGKVTNRVYREATGVTDRTAVRDLRELVDHGILLRVGSTGRGTHYVLAAETRHQPDKPDTQGAAPETRQEPDKADRLDSQRRET